jgi:hypothetical protein
VVGLHACNLRNGKRAIIVATFGCSLSKHDLKKFSVHVHMLVIFFKV